MISLEEFNRMQNTLRSQFNFWDSQTRERSGKGIQPGEFDKTPLARHPVYGEIQPARVVSREGKLVAVTPVAIYSYEKRYAQREDGRERTNAQAAEALLAELAQHLPESARCVFTDRIKRRLEIHVPLDPESHPELSGLLEIAKRHEEKTRALQRLERARKKLGRKLVRATQNVFAR